IARMLAQPVVDVQSHAHNRPEAQRQFGETPAQSKDADARAGNDGADRLLKGNGRGPVGGYPSIAGKQRQYDGQWKRENSEVDQTPGPAHEAVAVVQPLSRRGGFPHGAGAPSARWGDFVHHRGRQTPDADDGREADEQQKHGSIAGSRLGQRGPRPLFRWALGDFTWRKERS